MIPRYRARHIGKKKMCRVLGIDFEGADNAIRKVKLHDGNRYIAYEVILMLWTQQYDEDTKEIYD